MLRRSLVLSLLITLLLGACTQPGKGTPQPAASVAFTSHADGTIVTGSRAVTVVAKLTDALADAEISIEHNGAAVTGARSGDQVAIAVTLADHVNAFSISVANPDQDTPGGAALSLDFPFITLVTGQAASLAIGQTDLTTTGEAAPDKEFYGLYGRPLVADGVLYLPDYGVNRILGYHSVPTASGAAADFVLGQASFTDRETGPSPAELSGPQTVTTDGERLFVVDYDDDRILVYDSLPTTTGAPADHVIGQADLLSREAGCSATRLRSPESAIVVDGKLIVADGGNGRVLIWDPVPTEVDTPATFVLGQGSKDTCTRNDDDQDGTKDGAPTARTMSWPTDVWSDGERLVVADAGNNRLLIWQQFPTNDFAPADLVLGQPDFGRQAPGPGASGLDSPYMLHGNGNQLFVADTDNNRVLIWNEFPTENGQPADVVLGQANMIDNAEDAGQLIVNAVGMGEINGVYAYGNQLFVADYKNHRYLVFEGANP